jgi:probable rRNA maturation factor
MPSATASSIKFHFLTPAFSFHGRTELKQFLLRQIKKGGRSVEAINYIFCSDEYLLDLNQSHLGHDTYTDIITFELSAPGEPLVADIYISVERVRENASGFGVSFKAELLRVVFHGALHLIGFKDKSANQSKQMREMEDSWLAAFSS